jgi:hypothetical protein
VLSLPDWRIPPSELAHFLMFIIYDLKVYPCPTIVSSLESEQNISYRFWFGGNINGRQHMNMEYAIPPASIEYRIFQVEKIDMGLLTGIRGYFKLLKQVAIHALNYIPQECVTHYGVNRSPFMKKDRHGLVRLPRKIDGTPIKQSMHTLQ